MSVSEPSSPKRPPLRVLIVEGDPKALLQTEGCLHGAALGAIEVEMVPDVLLARARVAEQSFDVVLTELWLGARSGLSLARELAADPDCVVLVVSDDVDPGVEGQLLAAGVADLLPKQGLDSSTLGRAVRYGLRRRADGVALRDAQQQLSEARAGFQVAFESPASGFSISSPQGRLLEVNTTFARMLGMTREQLQGLLFSEITFPEDVDHSAGFIVKALSGVIDRGQFEKRYRHVDGHAVPVLLSSTLVRDEHGLPSYFTTQVVDLTEQKRAEDRARAAEQRQRLVLASLPGTVVALYDRSLHVLEVKGTSTSAPNGPIDGPVGDEHLRALVSAESFTLLEPAMLAALAGESSELELDSRDGRDMHVDIAPFVEQDIVTGALTVWRDVSRQRAAEAELRAEQERFASMANNVPGMVFRFVRSPQGDISLVYASEGCVDIYGIPAEVLVADVGRARRATVHPDDIADRVASIEQSARDLTTWDWRGRHVMPDATIKHVHAMSVPMRRDDGTIVWDGIVSDETAIVEAHAREAQLVQHFQDTFEQAPIGMAVVDLSDRFIQVNDALCAIVGYDRDRLEGTTFAALTHPDDLDRDVAGMNALLAGELPTYRAEKRYLHAAGHPVWVAVSATVMRDARGSPLHLLSQVLDITEQRRLTERLQHMADHDPLTGLTNRRRFDTDLKVHIARCQRYGTEGALILLDVDNFKTVNDTLGHTAGDELIKSVASILRNNLRDTDVVARLGGDEFAVLVLQGDHHQTAALAEKLVTAIREQAVVASGDRTLRVTASLGVLMFASSQQLSPENAIVEADLAMYDAKEAGRDRYSFFSNDHSRAARSKSRTTRTQQIREAVDHGNFAVQAQPIRDLHNGHVSQHELLVRMVSETGDLIAPAAFLPIAERLGIIPEIDRWVTAQAVELLDDTASDDRPTALHVNLSGHSIGDRDLLASIESDLRNHPQVDPGRLVFEVTETAAVADIGRARQFAERLAALGCRFALDDFGAGFGSMYYLKHLPFDYIKIDGEFVLRCAANLTDQLIIKAAVTLAQGLGKHTIAEFVEDAFTQRLVRDLGVDFAQGYHIGRPQSPRTAAQNGRAPQHVRAS